MAAYGVAGPAGNSEQAMGDISGRRGVALP
jgi:hypothetical protein